MFWVVCNVQTGHPVERSATFVVKYLEGDLKHTV